MIVTFFSGCNFIEKKNIYGDWGGEIFNDSINFTFKQDSTCIIKFYKNNDSKPIVMNGLFDVSYYKFPNTINITNIQGLNYNLYSIF